MKVISFNISMHRNCVFLLLALLCLANPLKGYANTQARVPGTWILLDAASGAELKSRGADIVKNPGELVSIMTIYTALEIMNEKGIAPEDSMIVPLSDSTSQENLRRIVLKPGQATPFLVLLKAIAIVGAEDAALVIAQKLAGSEANFVKRMNSVASELGLSSSRFTAPIASKEQLSTSADLACIARALMHKYPQAFSIFSEKEFEHAGHRQRNHNPLLWRSPEISGAVFDSSGTGLIGTLSRADNDRPPRQLIVSIIGVASQDQTVNAAINLLRSGKLDFETLHLFAKEQPVTKVSVLSGNRDTLDVGCDQEIWVTLPRKTILSRGVGGFSTKLEYMYPLIAPIKSGEHIGTLKIFFDGKQIAEHPAIALNEIGKGSFFSRFIDTVRLKTSRFTAQTIIKGTENVSGKYNYPSVQ